MTAAWSIAEVRAAAENHQCIVVGGSFAAVCDWLELPENPADGYPSQQDVEPPDGVLVDALSARVIVAVHDALAPENRERFLALPIERAGTIAWKLVK